MERPPFIDVNLFPRDFLAPSSFSCLIGPRHSFRFHRFHCVRPTHRHQKHQQQHSQRSRQQPPAPHRCHPFGRTMLWGSHPDQARILGVMPRRQVIALRHHMWVAPVPGCQRAKNCGEKSQTSRSGANGDKESSPVGTLARCVELYMNGRQVS